MKGVPVNDGEYSTAFLPPPGSAKPLYFRGRECDEIFVTLLIRLISIKREIGHLCHDENKPSRQTIAAQPQTTAPAPAPLASASGMSTSSGSAPLPLFLHATEYT